MSLMDFSLLMLAVQPLFIYIALFAKEIDMNEGSGKPEPFNQSLLAITPSFSFFYMSQFWHALTVLGLVALLGIISAKIIEPRAKNRLDFNIIVPFVFSWLLIFGIGYWAISPSENQAPSYTLYEEYWPTIYFVGFMCATLFLKIVEGRRGANGDLSGWCLMLGAVIAGIAPLFGHAYFSALIVNVFTFIAICSACIEIDKKDDPSAGAISFFFGYLLMMGVGFSLFCKLINVIHNFIIS